MAVTCICKPLSCQCCCVTLPQRVLMAIMCVIGVVTAYGQRCAMNVAITRMVSHHAVAVSTSCPIPNDTGTKKLWSEMDQEILLSTFFVGYLLFHLPGGMLADYFGGRYVYSIGHLVSSLMTALMPVCVTHLPIPAIAALRGVVGFSQAVVYPSMSALVAKWVPFEERSVLGAFTFAAHSLGVAVGNSVSGVVMNFMSSWPSVFYFWAILGFAWNVFFLLFVYSQPEAHPSITEKEKNYLKESMPEAKRMKIPWRRMLLDKGILVLGICQIGSDYTMYLLITNTPKYLSDVLHADVKSNAIVSSVPFVGMWLGSVFFGKIVDYLLKVRHWNLKWVRRVGCFIAFILSSTFALLVGYMECNFVLVTVMFTLAVFTKGPHFTTFKVNHMDITVNFNGIVMAYINGLGAIGGIVPPYVVGTVAKDNTLDQWKIVFWISWIVSCLSGLLYLFTAQASRAEWDVHPEDLEEWLKERDKLKAEKEAKKQEKAKKKTEKAA